MEIGHVHLVGHARRRPGGTITGLGGKCADVAGGSSADGTRLQIWTCTGAANQKWTIS